MNKKIAVVTLFVSVLLLTISTGTPFVPPVGAEASEETMGIYSFIESLSIGSVVVLSFDFGPSTLPQNYPQAKNILFHCKQKGLRVIGVAFWAAGAPIGQDVFREIYGDAFPNVPEYGTSIVHLGYILGSTVGIRMFAEDTWSVITVDHFGNPFSNLPLMSEVRNATNFDLWMEIMAGSPGVPDVIEYVQTPYGGPAAVPVGAGCTIISYSVAKPYYDSGHLVGILEALQGASEYEKLLAGYYIEELIETIETWNPPKGTENSLKAKLKVARHMLDRGRVDGAIQKLTAFINRVETLRERTLTDEQADILAAEAQRIIDIIEG